jgi:HSP20 family protein
MGEDLIRLMHSLLRTSPEAVRETIWQPAVDVYQTRNGWLVKFDLAGVRPEDIRLHIDGSHLTVHGTRRDWSLEEGCSHFLMEIAYSRFERTVSLPANLERARVTMEHRHGMLLVRIQTEAPHP